MIKNILGEGVNVLKKRFWCAKTFPTVNVTKGLSRLYPNSKFIYIIRNGCDVVQSMSKFSGFRHQDFERNCLAWARSVENYDYLQDMESAIMVSHEQLIEKPDEVFEKVFSFIGIDNHENSANFIKNTLVHPLDKPTQTHVDVKTELSKRRPSYEKWTPELGYEVPF
jgi:hypothetical protein